MKRIRLVCVFMLVIFTLFPLSAAMHLSVPVDHRVYRLLESAEIRGLIEKQVAVRPYSAKRVLALLDEIASQPEKLSKAEQEELSILSNQLLLTYGTQPSSLENVGSTGFYRTYNEEKQMGASMGVNLATQQTVSLLHTKEHDSRNSLVAFLRGDLGNAVSFNMDFGLTLDKLNSRVFLPTEFTIPGEGFYNQLTQGGSQLGSIPSYEFYTGLTLSPEISAAFFGGSLQLRWGSIKRDWGPGLNNLLLSGSARSFDGIDIQVDFTPWLHYAVVNGSLAKFSLDDIDGEPFFSDDYDVDKPYYRFDNNYSAHRVELDVGKSLVLSIYEASVWQKRFELSYLNPLAIYMFAQNNQGDIDDLIAGVDFSYTLPNTARFYGGVATSEMHTIGSLKTILTAPRNMLAFQAGFVVPVPVGSFSSLTVQWTYLAPFFYAHYPIYDQSGTFYDLVAGTVDTDRIVTERGTEVSYTGTLTSQIFTVTKDDDTTDTLTVSVDSYGDWTGFTEDGRIKIVKDKDSNDFSIYETSAETAYVNKGENLGYPLNPNSQEFLVQLDLGLPKGWTTQLQAKYQVRSGQYGYSIEQFMNYSEHDDYPAKAFWDNTFEHTLSILLKATKKLTDMPIELSAAYRFISVWEREILNPSYDGRHTLGYGPWESPEFDHIVQVGAKIYL